MRLEETLKERSPRALLERACRPLAELGRRASALAFPCPYSLVIVACKTLVLVLWLGFGHHTRAVGIVSVLHLAPKVSVADGFVNVFLARTSCDLKTIQKQSQYL